MHVGDLAVERRRTLQRHVRPALAHGRDEHAVLARGLGGEQAHLHPDAGRLQLCHAAPGHERVGIELGGDDPNDACRGDRRRTGRRPAVVRARLERDVQGGAAGTGTRRRERPDLGVRPAGPEVRPLADDLPVADEDGADHGVG